MRNLAKYTNRPNPPESENGVSHLDVATLLLEKGADPNAALHEDRSAASGARQHQRRARDRRRSIAPCAPSTWRQ